MTSALVAAGTLAIADDAWAQKAANPVSLRVGGYMEQTIGFSFGRRDNLEQTGIAANTPGAYGAPNGTFDQQTEAEIHFIGDGRLDNGLVIRAVIELEVTGSPGNMIDEQFLILRNGYGQVILGNEDPAASLMTTGYISNLVTGVGQSIVFDLTDFINAPAGWTGGSPILGTQRDVRLEKWDGDASKIIYITPRFFGLQFGASYAPEGTQDLQNGAGAIAGNSPPTKEIYSDQWSAGINYEIKFDQVAIGLAAGYVTAKSAGVGVGANGFRLDKDPEMWAWGGRIIWGGLTALAGYNKMTHLVSGTGIGVPGPTTAGGINAKHGDAWNVGVRYRWGPNAVSFGFTHGEETGLYANPGNDELNSAIASYARTLAPGISWRANVVYADFDNEANLPGAITQQDYDELALTTSFRLDW
jgi:predicted porin